jgi:predicted Na+-dependent transporter
MNAENIANTVNSKLERLMPFLSPFGVLLGFLLSGVFIHLRPFVPWIFGIITLSGVLRIRAVEFLGAARSPLPILAFFVSCHVLMPLIVMHVSSFFFSADPDTVTGYVLVFSAPTAASGIIWVLIFRGDKAFCLTLILIDTLLAPLVVPGTVSLLMGTKVAMSMSSIAFSLFLMIVLPTIIGITINEASRGKIPSLICPYINPAAKISLILVIASNAAPIASKVRFDDPKVWGIAALCIVFSAGGFLLSRLFAGIVRCNPEKSVSMLISGGMRNITAVTTVAVTFFPEAAVLPSLLSILFQHSVAALMGKLMSRKK